MKCGESCGINVADFLGSGFLQGKWQEAVDRHEAGFFVLQSQMQQLPLPLGAAEASAQRNNGKNMQQYIHWAHDRKMNVMSFDFVNYGNLCGHVINFYDARYQALSQSLAAEATAG